MFHPRGPSFWELAKQCLSSTERGYDLLAPKFDFTPFRTPDAILEGVAKVLGPPQSIDDALASTSAAALWDVRISYEIMYLPFVFGRGCYVVEGRVP